MSDETTQNPERSRWREDPLSVFLALAAVLLGLMYFLEQRDVGVLQEASTRAKELGATTLDIEGCTVGSASTDGRTLVVSCVSSAADAASAAALRSPSLPDFDAVVFIGNDAQLACGTSPAKWPNGCTSRAIPSTQ